MLNSSLSPSEGVILKGIGGFYQVLHENGSLTCKLRGKLRQDAGDILVGDRVSFSIINEPDDDFAEGIIEKILPRKNQLVRPKIANITGAIFTLSVVTPAPDWLLLDKMLVQAAISDLDVVICINKYDALKGAKKAALEAQVDVYRHVGYQVRLVSAKEYVGITELGRALGSGIWVMSGASGVGKSSILNGLTNEIRMEVGKVSERLGRGKHTTRHVEIIQLGQGVLLADTPGFSLLDLPESLEVEDLRFYYPEFPKNRCRFDTCLHYKEPDCRIKEMVGAGEIDAGRYERYINLLESLKEREVKY